MSNAPVTKPPVPRRSQSFKIVRNYSDSGLRVVDIDADPNKHRSTRPVNKKLRTRRSLDAMEKQAGELLDFLSELENKKASSSDDDILAFLTDSKPEEINSPSSKSPDKKFPVRRVSVKDRAKLFLKPDIKEETHSCDDDIELDKNSNHVSKKFQNLSLAPSLVSCNASCNNNKQIKITSTKLPISSRYSACNYSFN